MEQQSSYRSLACTTEVSKSTFFRFFPAKEAAAIEAEAARLADWLGPVRVTPRFHTPLERELAA